MKNKFLKRSLFNQDGTNFKPSEDSMKLIVGDDGIEEFLEERFYSPKRIIVGPKGAGKSILLCTRSWLTKNKSQVFNIPRDKNSHTFKFTLTNDLNKKALLEYVKEDSYEIVWKFCIRYFILINLMLGYKIEIQGYGLDDTKLPGSDIFAEIMPEGSQMPIGLGHMVSLILTNRSKISEIEKQIGSLDNILSRLQLYLEDPITVYIDNVDQTFLDKLRYTPKDDGYGKHLPLEAWESSKKEFPITSIWLNANIAFLKSVWDINKDQSHVLVFASVRYEAWFHLIKSYSYKNIAQLKSSCLFLDYKKPELLKLIENFVSIQDDNIKKEMNKLFTTERIHPKAKNGRNNREIFKELLIRHTFGFPRDLIILLEAIRNQIGADLKEGKEINENRYALQVDLITNQKIFKENFELECLPSFPREELNNFLKKHPFNYFKLEDLSPKNNAIELKLIKVLNRYGLIGIVSDGIQKFRKGSNYPEEYIELPPSPIYLLHPCLDYELSKINSKDFYYPHCIIGHDLTFVFKNALDYYLPKKVSARCSDNNNIEVIFKAFYERDDAIDNFNKIPEDIKQRYLALLLNACANKSKKILDLYVSERIDDRFVKCGNLNKGKIIFLRRNIKLRIILCLASILEIYQKGSDVIELFKGASRIETIYAITFTQGCYTTPTRSIKIKTVLETLSEYEKEIVLNLLESRTVKEYIDGLDREFEKQTRVKTLIDKAINMIKKL